MGHLASGLIRLVTDAVLLTVFGVALVGAYCLANSSVRGQDREGADMSGGGEAVLRVLHALRRLWLRRPGRAWSPELLLAEIAPAVRRHQVIMPGRVVVPSRWSAVLSPRAFSVAETYGLQIVEETMSRGLSDLLRRHGVHSADAIEVRIVHSADCRGQALVPDRAPPRSAQGAEGDHMPGHHRTANALTRRLHLVIPEHAVTERQMLEDAGLGRVSGHARQRAAELDLELAEVVEAFVSAESTRPGHDNRTVYIRGPVHVVVANDTRDIVTVWTTGSGDDRQGRHARDAPVDRQPNVRRMVG